MPSNIVEIITAVAGLLGVSVAIVTFLVTRHEQKRQLAKGLEVALTGSTRLRTGDVARFGNKLKLVYEGKEVADLSILQVRVKNSGGQPIRPEDFVEPVRINIQDALELVSVELINSEPRGLKIKASVSGSTAILDSTLLNPDDEFTIQIVGVPTGVGGMAISEVNGRVAGVKAVVFTDRMGDSARARPTISIFGLPVDPEFVGAIASGILTVLLLNSFLLLTQSDLSRFIAAVRALIGK